MSFYFIYVCFIAPATVLFPIGAGLYTWPHLGKPEKLIWFYLIVGGLTDAGASWLSFHRINNLWLSHVYTPIETLFFLFYYYWIIKDKLTRNVIKVIMVLYPLFCIANAKWFQGVLLYNTYTLYPEVLILLYLGIVCFLERSEAPIPLKGTREASLPWINGGILVYMGGSFFYFLYFNFFRAHHLMNKIVTIGHSSLLVVMYVCIMIGYLRCRK